MALNTSTPSLALERIQQALSPILAEYPHLAIFATLYDPEADPERCSMQIIRGGDPSLPIALATILQEPEARELVSLGLELVSLERSVRYQSTSAEA